MIQGGYSNFDPDLDWRLERAFQKGWKERFKKLFRSQADKKKHIALAILSLREKITNDRAKSSVFV